MNVKCSSTFVLLILSNYYACISSISCTGENGKAVDWYVIYKIPKIKNPNKLIKNGLGYIYITSETNQEWHFSNNSITANNSLIANTLAPMYRNKSDIAYVFYNDQPPNKPSKPNKGHTKGVVLADVNGGLWLIHSVPHFPSLGPDYNYPPTGIVKGQSFLCISLDLKNLNKVGTQLQYNQPQIYSSYMPADLGNRIQQVVKAVSGVVVSQPPWYNRISIISKGGVSFTSFAKSNQFGKDLYEDWVAPSLLSNFLVETWLNGEGKLPSNCSKPFKVYNVEELSMNVLSVAFNSTQDHSKWAVSQNSSWICVGDINRMEHQKHRGGGTVCLNNKKLSSTYRDCIKEIEKCHDRSAKEKSAHENCKQKKNYRHNYTHTVKSSRVYNIKEVSMNVVNVAFNTSQDYSKWAASQNSIWICVGEINRTEEQKHRGGGTVCLNNKKLSSTYRRYVKEKEKCPVD